ncbi:hypothetical protein HPB50_003299 [Hyalomma asiaticum]|uniref:Uncharacterized protein n=1 Tax=Hyalomma asiaticum TaxID=266040 RepID=A0ACB7RXP1_HYAAI|nr:hypothetical protein HPB50_003299 [Hyalomma asiaticum]
MKATIKDGVVYSPHPKVDIPLFSVYTAMKGFLLASPERVALLDENMRLTRGEFFSRLRSFAAGFQAHGIGLGDRVCVHLDNSVENMVALLSITFTGASVLLSNPILNENRLTELALSRPRRRLVTSCKRGSLGRKVSGDRTFLVSRCPAVPQVVQQPSYDWWSLVPALVQQATVVVRGPLGSKAAEGTSWSVSKGGAPGMPASCSAVLTPAGHAGQ